MFPLFWSQCRRTVYCHGRNCLSYCMSDIDSRVLELQEYTGQRLAKKSDLYENALLYNTVHPKKYAHGFCFAVLCCGYTLTDFPISIRLTSLTPWQSNDCPSASKATLMNMDKYFIWIHYERLHSSNKTKHNKTVCIFLGIYCISRRWGLIWNGMDLSHCYATCVFSVLPDWNKNSTETSLCDPLRSVYQHDWHHPGTLYMALPW